MINRLTEFMVAAMAMRMTTHVATQIMAQGLYSSRWEDAVWAEIEQLVAIRTYNPKAKESLLPDLRKALHDDVTYYDLTPKMVRDRRILLSGLYLIATGRATREAIEDSYRVARDIWERLKEDVEDMEEYSYIFQDLQNAMKEADRIGAPVEAKAKAIRELWKLYWDEPGERVLHYLNLSEDSASILWPLSEVIDTAFLGPPKLSPLVQGTYTTYEGIEVAGPVDARNRIIDWLKRPPGYIWKDLKLAGVRRIVYLPFPAPPRALEITLGTADLRLKQILLFYPLTSYTFIHEAAHFIYPEMTEEEIVRMTPELAERKLGSRWEEKEEILIGKPPWVVE